MKYLSVLLSDIAVSRNYKYIKSSIKTCPILRLTLCFALRVICGQELKNTCSILHVNGIIVEANLIKNLILIYTTDLISNIIMHYLRG